MSESLGYRRTGAAVLRDDHDIKPPAAAEELPDPGEFEGIHEVLAVARVCPVVLRGYPEDDGGRGWHSGGFTEFGWSGQSVKGSDRPKCDRQNCTRCSLKLETERSLQAVDGGLEESPNLFEWVPLGASAVFEFSQHPEVRR
jgi:hypothetical protein